MKLNKWERIKASVDNIERGFRPEFTLDKCADYVAWVAKFGKVPREEWEPVCDRITELFETGYGEFYFSW